MKKLLAVLLAAMMVFCLAACGDKDEEKKSKKSDSDLKRVSVEDKEDNDNGNASAVEKSRIKTDEANARCLKLLLVTSYMGDDAFDTSATYYLSSDGKSIQTSSSGAMKYVSKKYKDNGYISGTCSDDGIVTINCEGIYENTSVPAPAEKVLPDGYDHCFSLFLTDEELQLVNRVEVMDMLDRVFFTNAAKVQNVSIKGNTVSVTLYDVTLEETGTLQENLLQLDAIVQNVFMETANTNKDRNGKPLPNGKQVLTANFTVNLDPYYNGPKERPTPETIGETDDFTKIADYNNSVQLTDDLNQIFSVTESFSLVFENPVRETNCWRRTLNISFKTNDEQPAMEIIRKLDAMEHGCLISDVTVTVGQTDDGNSANVNLKATVFEYEVSSESP